MQKQRVFLVAAIAAASFASLAAAGTVPTPHRFPATRVVHPAGNPRLEPIPYPTPAPKYTVPTVPMTPSPSYPWLPPTPVSSPLGHVHDTSSQQGASSRGDSERTVSGQRTD